jgi:putative SOS response-associated peptidase YedK
MPLVLPSDRWAAWLGGAAGPDLLTPASPEFLSTVEIRPVGAAVGSVRNDGPSLVERVAAPLPGAPPEDPVELTLF